MENRFANWIVVIAGCSYLGMGGLYLIICIVMGWLPITDPIVYKGVPWLLIYFFSLGILGKAEKADDITKLKVWGLSCSIHIILMVFVYQQLGNDSIYIMYPEVGVLILYLLAISGIGIRHSARNLT